MASQSESKRVLVTGANGFLGSHIVHELHNRGHQVNTLDTMSPRNNLHHTHWHVDIRNFGAVDEAVSAIKPHWVIHLAAIHYIPYCNLHPGETFDVNVKGTYNLLRALRSPVERIFVASSAGVYSPSLMPHSETDPAWPLDIYGFSKRATEEVIKNSEHPFIIGRYFNMYGWGETTPHLIPTLIEQIRGSNYIELGNTQTRRDFIHVSDNARATVDLLEMNLRGDVIINLGSGRSYSAANLVSMLSKITNKHLTVTVDPSRMRETDRPNLVADITKLYSLGLPQPRVSIWDGLKDLVDNGIGPYLRDPLA